MSTELETVEEPEVAVNGTKSDGFDAVWAFFSSMKTAIVLILILAAAAIIGTLIKPEDPNDPGQIFRSSWFEMLLILVGINLVVCSINRFGMAWKRTFNPSKVIDPKQLAKRNSETLNSYGSVEAAAEKIAGTLRSSLYSVEKSEKVDGAISIYASKGRLSIWGPYLTHLSLLVIFLGAIIGSYFGFEGNVTIMEGASTGSCVIYKGNEKPEEKDLGFRVGLKEFTATADAEHNPTNYQSDLQIFAKSDSSDFQHMNGMHGHHADEKPLFERSISVNHPLTYKGISLFQSSYGVAAIMLNVIAPDGQSVDVPFMVDEQTGGYISMLDMPISMKDKKLDIMVNDFAPDFVPQLKRSVSPLPINPAVHLQVNDKDLDWVMQSNQAKYDGYTFTLKRTIEYTGLSVSSNPGLNIIYLGFALMVLGVIISFYMAHKVIRVHISDNGQGTAKVILAATSRSDSSVFEKDLGRIRKTLTE